VEVRGLSCRDVRANPIKNIEDGSSGLLGGVVSGREKGRGSVGPKVPISKVSFSSGSSALSNECLPEWCGCSNVCCGCQSAARGEGGAYLGGEQQGSETGQRSRTTTNGGNSVRIPKEMGHPGRPVETKRWLYKGA